MMKTTIRRWGPRGVAGLLLVAVVVGLGQGLPQRAGDRPPRPAPGTGTDYLARPSYRPENAQYFDLINTTLGLTAEERAKLQDNGFVVSDRLAVNDFTTAYAYIYWKDLPVLITTDSLLHAIHQTQDDLVQQLEATILTSRLARLLAGARQQAQAAARANADPVLAPLYADLDVYLAVPQSLLAEPDAPPAAAPPRAAAYRAAVLASDQVQTITLFGGERKIDFTLFKPRGHYAGNPVLTRYFQAMSWLALVDFRLLAYDTMGNPQVQPPQIAAATLLRTAIDQAGGRPLWQELDALFDAFVGRSDNTTLTDLDRFLADAGTPDAAAVLHADPARLLQLLTSRDYGKQRINNQMLQVDLANPQPLPRPVSFELFGQRFAIDSYILNNLAFDRLQVNGQKVYRALPSPLDVMYALGNDRAGVHLQDELQRYGYQDTLTALRESVAQSGAPFWASSTYNRTLGLLRTLNAPTTGPTYPQAMRTAAWADKTLQTQLGAWTQLRHDNLLYAKYSVIAQALCSYPAGYVEPYPAFYTEVADYAQAGHTLFDSLDPTTFTPDEQALRATSLTYFAHLQDVATRLQRMADKELRLEPFDAEEQAFLKSTAVRKLVPDSNSCVPSEHEDWNGWYPELFPWQDQSPALIADVHTNPNDDPSTPLYPPSVLHVATGSVATAVFIADTDEGPTAYVGPTYTYYEVVQQGYPPVRLSDQDWFQQLFADSEPPAPPAWTAGFRLPTTRRPDFLRFPPPNTP